MNALKTLLVGAVLTAAAYGVYMAVTAPPPAVAPPENENSVARGLTVETGSEDAAVSATSATTDAEPDEPGGDDEPAPKFVPQPRKKSPGGRSASTSADPFANRTPKESHDDGESPFAPPEPPSGENSEKSRGDARKGYPRTGSPDDELTSVDETEDDRNLPVAYVAPSGDAADVRAEFEDAMEKIDRLLKRDKLADAHLELSKWYENAEISDEQFHRMMELLEQVAGTVVYSTESLLEPEHVVARNETLADVAQAHQVSPELLANVNGLSPKDRLKAGQKLKVLPGPFRATVDLADQVLTLWIGDRYAGRFAIAVGADRGLTAGEYEIEKKVVNPPYQGSPPSKADALDNPLGKFALRVGTTAWIHGTNAAEGRQEGDPRGWIRLSAGDIVDVYDILTVGSAVTIRD